MARILVIEDNPANMALASTVLSTQGHAVLQAINAHEGIALARRELPDLVLLDVELPGMDGLEATAVLKSAEATSHIPIVALTASAMKGDRARCQAAGCDGYMTKPFEYRELLELVARLLANGAAVE